MAKSKGAYTLDEAMSLLRTNRAAILLMLALLRPGLDPGRVGKIRISEIERMYQMMRDQQR